MRPADIAALTRVMGAACDAAEARLTALRREEAELRRQIGALQEARRQRVAEARATDVTLRAGVDLRWDGWVERRSAALTAELARLLARIEVAKAELARVLGRRTATEDLAARVRTAALARCQAREERGW